MNVISTDLRINFSAKSEGEPFDLVEDNDPGSKPVTVWTVLVPTETKTELRWVPEYRTGSFILVPGHYEERTFVVSGEWAFRHKEGFKRIRLYCSREISPKVKLKIGNSSLGYMSLGRRSGILYESITFNGAKMGMVKYGYGTPNVEVLDHTGFVDAEGTDVDPPTQVGSNGIFNTPIPVTGTLTVRYSPEYTLFSIPYDPTGNHLSAVALKEMITAWNRGNINDAHTPTLEVLAIAPGLSARLSLRRDYFPMGRQYPAMPPEEIKEPEVVKNKIVNQPQPDSCWDKCKKLLFPDISYLEVVQNREYKKAVNDCSDSRKSPKYQYVETSRKTRQDRIQSPDDPTSYIDIDRTVEIVLTLQRVDGCPCEDPNAPTGSNELVFRFTA